ncbi:MAG TPA: DUF1329 domain-containing protein [Candidatus Binataceae bacterium]|nr:DUF1329 domain-containing protein [Candidatus Binataceae bacterium]
MKRKIWRCIHRLGLGVALAMALMALPSYAGAQVKPGDFITPANAAKVKDITPPGIYWHVVNGMTMNIVPTGRVDWPPPFKDATEKYSSQVQLSRDHKSMVGYVAGLPFPLIDDNDPYAGAKIIWNNTFRPIATDDYDLRMFECDATRVNPGKKPFIINNYIIGHYAGYNLVGRTEVEPLPIDPDFKVSGAYYLFGLYPVIAPSAYRGAGIVRYRYADPKRGDDAWSYNRNTRRVRRLNESTLSIATGFGGSNPDHYGGFNPKNEFYNYKFLGEKKELSVIHAKFVPEHHCMSDGGVSICPENWEMRDDYIVQATATHHYNAVEGKNLIYMDSEAWYSTEVDTYDRQGQLFQNFSYLLTYRDRPVPDARIAIYPFKRIFVVGTFTCDLQSGACQPCYLPGPDVAERECWYINMGAIDKQFFTREAMQRAGETGNGNVE